jgi:phosphoglucosamine mutase
MCGLFGTSGIRRRVSDFPQGFAYALGRALGSMEKMPVAVGRDTRSSGPDLEGELVDGLTSSGCLVSLLDVVPTPTVGVATKDHGVGVVITASHNPPEYNGFKLLDKKGAFWPERECELERILEGKGFKNGIGSYQKRDYRSLHIKKIVDCVGDADGVRVLLDCAGGAGSTVTPSLLEGMGCKTNVVNDNLDGVFPHPLEPTAENLKDTCRCVAKSEVDICFAHDGDADRTCAIDGDGKLIEWDTFLTCLATGHKRVVTTVDASMRIEDFAGKVIRVAVGDVAVAEGIRKHKAGFGGEPSGTYIFPDIHMFPDGVAAAAKAARMVAEGEFYRLVSEIPSYPMERVKIPVESHEKKKIMENLKEVLKGEPYTSVDGYRIAYDSGWVLLRPSGTEDYMRITAEAENKEGLDKRVAHAKEWVKKARR